MVNQGHIHPGAQDDTPAAAPKHRPAIDKKPGLSVHPFQRVFEPGLGGRFFLAGAKGKAA